MKPKPVAETEQKPPQHYVKLIAALLLLGVAGCFLWHALKPERPKINPKPFISLGEFAADELGRFGGHGENIRVIVPVAGRTVPPFSQLALSLKAVSPEVAAFKARLAQQGRFTFSPDWELPQPARAQATVWPAGDLAKLLGETPDDAILVAFCSLPAALTGGEARRLQGRTGKVMVVGVLDSEARRLVDARLVSVAIAARVPVPPFTGTGAEPPEDWVKRVFVVLKP